MATAAQLSIQAMLTRPYNLKAEHRILSRLIGDWQMRGDWHLLPDDPTPIGGVMENRGILGGHFIESRTFFEGVERSRVIYGYDPEAGQFMAFAINGMAARWDLELGTYDREADQLRFSCVELVGEQRLPVRFERTLTFQPDGAFDLRITYPEREPERRLGMELRMRRNG